MDVSIKITIRQFLRDDQGATAVEYAMLVSLFAVAILGWAHVAGEDINDTFEIASDTMDEAKDLGVDVPVKARGGD